VNWLDRYEIALALEDLYPEVDIAHIRFIDLREMVLSLKDFTGIPQHCNEKILESIQAAWLDERA